MATLTPLVPNGDRSTSTNVILWNRGASVWTSTGTTGSFAHIDETVGAIGSGDTGIGLLTTANVTQAVQFELTATDANFVSMDTISAHFDLAMQGTYSDDTGYVRATIFNNAGTALTNQIVLINWNGTTFTPGSPPRINQTIAFSLTAAGLSANKAAWDAAYLQLTFEDVKSKASDGATFILADVRLTGTYTAGAITNTLTHTSDVFKKATRTLTHTSDVLAFALRTLTHTSDVFLNFQQTLTHTSDVLTTATVTHTHTSDVFTIVPTPSSLFEVEQWGIYANGTEAGSTQLNSAAYRGAVVPVDVPIQLRWAILNNDGVDHYIKPRLQYRYISKGGGGAVDWTPARLAQAEVDWFDAVTATSTIANWTTGTASHGTATTQRIGTGGTFVAGTVVAGAATPNGSVLLSDQEETEFVFTIELDSTDIPADNQTNIQFRIVNDEDGSVYSLYEQSAPSQGEQFLSVNPPWVWENDLEAGTNGNAITASESSPDNFDVINDTSSTMTYTNTNPAHGSIAGVLNKASGDALARARWWDINQGHEAWMRFYFRPVSDDTTYILVRGDGGYEGGDVQTFIVEVITGTREVRLRNAANTILGTTTAQMSVGTWYRIEIHWVSEITDLTADGTLELRLYTGDSTTADETLGPYTTATRTEWEDIDFGHRSATGAAHFVFDDIKLSNEDWVGPWSGATTNTLTHTSDLITKDTATLTHTSDVLLLETSTLTHTSDVIANAVNTLTHTSDTLLLETFTLTHTSDVLVYLETTLTHTSDVFTTIVTPYTVHDLDIGEDLTVYTTASVTPTVDALQILMVHATDNNTINLPTVDGSAAGVTWELYSVNDDARKLYVYHAAPASPSTGATTITFDESIEDCMWSWTEWPDRLNTDNGLDAFAQSPHHNQVGFDVESHVAMQEWVDAPDSIGLAAFVIGSTSAITPWAGWTDLHEIASGFSTLHLQISEVEAYKPGIDWISNAHHIGTALELLPLVSPEPIPDSITAPVLLKEFSGTGTTGTSTTYTPTDGALLLAAFDFRRAAGSPVSPSTVTGNGVTWTEVGAIDYNTVGTPTRRMSVWSAKSDGTAGGITPTFGTSADAWRVSVWEVGGVTPASLSTDDVVQFDTDAADSVTAINATLASFGNTLNGTLAFFANTVVDEYPEVEDGASLANKDTANTFYLAWQFSNNLTPGVAVMDSGDAAILAMEIDPAVVATSTLTHTSDLIAVATATLTHTSDVYTANIQTLTHTSDVFTKATNTLTHTSDVFTSSSGATLTFLGSIGDSTNNPVTLSLTIPSYSGTGRLVVVAGMGAGGDRTVTMTWNGSEATTEQAAVGNRQTNYQSYLHTLDNPTAGSFDLVASWDGAIGSGSLQAWLVDNVDTGVTPGTGAAEGNSADATVNVTTAAANSMLIGGGAGHIAINPMTPGSQVEVEDVDAETSGGGDHAYWGGHDTDAGVAGSKTWNFTCTSGDWQVVVIEVPVTAGGATEQTLTHTSDVVLLAEQTLTHTSDVLLLAESTLTHLSDVYTVNVNTLTHTSDLIAYITPTLTHLSDVYAVNVNTLTHTSDVIGLLTSTLTHTSDLITYITVTLTHISDLITKATLDLTHSSDVFTEQAGIVTLTHQSDVLTIATQTLTHTSDLIAFNLRTLTHTSDLLAKATIDLTHTSDLITQATTAITHTSDVFTEATGTNTLTHLSDVLTIATLDLTHTSDVLTNITPTLTHTSDLLALRETTLPHTSDVIAYITNTLTHSSDVVLIDTFTLTHLSDVLLQDTFTLTHTSDVYTEVTGTVTLAHMSDVRTTGTPTLTHTSDVLVVLVTTLTHTSDLLAKSTFTRTHTSDVLVYLETTLTHTSDLLAIQTSTLTHTSDTITILVPTLTHTSDVFTTTKVTNTVTHTSDVSVQDTFTLTHGSDTFVSVSSEKSHTSDVLVELITSLTHTSDVYAVTSIIVTESGERILDEGSPSRILTDTPRTYR